MWSDTNVVLTLNVYKIIMISWFSQHCKNNLQLMNKFLCVSVTQTNPHHTVTIKHCLKYNIDVVFDVCLLRQPATDNYLSFITHHRGGENISELLAPSHWWLWVGGVVWSHHNTQAWIDSHSLSTSSNPLYTVRASIYSFIHPSVYLSKNVIMFSVTVWNTT